MKTSIILIFSFLLCCSFLALPGFGQENMWEPYAGIESTLFNTQNDELNLLRLGNSTLVTRIICGKPQQFILNQQGVITPYRWKPDFLNELSIPYIIMHDSALYFSTPTIGRQQAVLSLYEYKDGVLKQLDTSQKSSYSSQPCMSPDGKTLYFVSNRDGGFGGTDIWYFNRDINTNAWIGPFAMGEQINSPSDEKNPFLPHPDTLYFSTNMDGGKGGYDILFSVRENGIWGSPVPIEEFNTKSDDSDFMMINDSIAVVSRNNDNQQSDFHWYKKNRISKREPSWLDITTENITEISQNINYVDNSIAFRNCIFPSTFKKHDAFMIQTLGKRLADNPEAKITLSNHASTKKIQDLLLSQGAKPEQVTIAQESTDSHILFTGNSSLLFNPFSNVKNKCTPSSFTINITSFPPGVVTSWKLFANDFLLKEDAILPNEYTFETNQHITPFEELLTITAHATDIYGNEISDTANIIIKPTIQNEAGNLISEEIPTIWNCKNESQFFNFLETYLSSYKENAHTIELFSTDYNVNTIQPILEKLSVIKEFSRWKFILSNLTSNNKLSPMIRLSVSHVPGEERAYMIPILVK